MKIIIEGAGEVGTHLAKMLSSEANEITIIDSDEAKLNSIASVCDVNTIIGPSSTIHVLKDAGVEKAELFIAVNPFTSQDVNVVSALLAKKLGCQKVCARVDNEEYLTYGNSYIFREMGIDLMFYPERIAADEIVDSLKRKTSAESMDFARGKLQMSVFKIEDDSPLLDMNVKEFGQTFQGDEKAVVLAISRDNETIVPGGDVKFKYNDIVHIITKREGFAPVMKFLRKENQDIRNVMIIGGTPIGEMVARSIAGTMDRVTIIEPNKSLCQELSERTPDNVYVINADGRNSDVLQEQNIRDMEAFVAVTENDEQNVLSCIVAKRFGIERAIAEVENLEYIGLAEKLGVDSIINKKKITAGKIVKMTLSDKARLVKYLNGTNAEVIEYIVSERAKITSVPVKDLNFPDGAIIGGVIRGNNSFVVNGNTLIEPYDRVAVFALPDVIKDVDKFFK